MGVERSREPDRSGIHSPGGGALDNDPAPTPKNSARRVFARNNCCGRGGGGGLTGHLPALGTQKVSSLSPSNHLSVPMVPRSQILSVTFKDIH